MRCVRVCEDTELLTDDTDAAAALGSGWFLRDAAQRLADKCPSLQRHCLWFFDTHFRNLDKSVTLRGGSCDATHACNNRGCARADRSLGL